MKLKVLCLQGYRQNETVFRERSGAFRKLVKKYMEFTFISAPHVIPGAANRSRAENEQERGWWFSRPEKSYNALDKTEHCIGFEDTLKLIQETFESQGPFDGVMGFSQGAALLSLLCVLRSDPSNDIDFKFTIFFAGFKSLVSPHASMYSGHSIDCPSFHTIGSTDAVIPSQSSEELLDMFVKPVAYRHDGGHYVPASPQLRTAITEFITPFMT